MTGLAMAPSVAGGYPPAAYNMSQVWSPALSSSSSSASPSSAAITAAASAAVAAADANATGDELIDVCLGHRRRPRDPQEPMNQFEVSSAHHDWKNECLLAPQLKRLRLSEEPAGMLSQIDATDMAVDASCPATPPRTVPMTSPNSSPPVFSPFGSNNCHGDGSFDAATAAAFRTMTNYSAHARASPSCSPMSDRPEPEERPSAFQAFKSGDPAAQAAWKAEVQRRAAEELRRYRQAVRNCEGGVAVRPCAGLF
eukprot:TRINITY_DN5917_c1_g1_i1.p1 TRINITY_DN5917_c1_g1~~TRINITY_DN5917_c1_g1_i1.p1  ORF type:complete len:254 (+),score=51.94 TRINITY_DN5917_c1_g1_i1:91-852(+)